MNSLPFSRSETIMLAGTTLLAGLFFGAGLGLKVLRTIPEISISKRIPPYPNAYDTLTEASSAYVSPVWPVDAVQENRPPLTLPNGQVKERTYALSAKDAWIAGNAKALILLRQALTQRYMPPQDPSQIRYGSYAGFRELARLLTIESHSRRLHGNWAGAGQSAFDILRLGNQVTQGGGDMMDGVWGATIQAMGQNAMWEVLPHLSAVESRKLSLQMQGIRDRRVPWSGFILESKRKALISYIEAMKKGQIQTSSIPQEDNDANPVQARLNSYLLNYRLIIKNSDQYYSALAASFSQPYAKSLPVNAPACSAGDPITCQAVFDVRGMRFSAARNEISASLLQLSLALRAYKLETGKYPRTLQELAPRYLKSVPRDAFGLGGPITYMPAANGYKLYSVGPDGADDKGIPIQNAGAQGRKKWFVSRGDKGDFVAGLNY